MVKDKRKSILLSILIAIGGLSTLAFSYAFVRLNPDATEQLIRSKSASIILEYKECDTASDESCGEVNKNLKVGESASKKFSIENIGTVDTDTPLYFIQVKNTFENDELVYTLKDLTNNTVLITQPVPYSDEISLNQLAYSNLHIPSGERIEYELTVTFISVNGDQNYNLNADYFIILGISQEY